jgi:hypothetical protein
MDIDANRKRIPISVSCFQCGKPSHKILDCPLKYDIRALTTDELKAKLEARLAKRDVVPTEDCPSIEEEGTPVPDFLQDNE